MDDVDESDCLRLGTLGLVVAAVMVGVVVVVVVVAWVAGVAVPLPMREVLKVLDNDVGRRAEGCCCRCWWCEGGDTVSSS